MTSRLENPLTADVIPSDACEATSYDALKAHARREGFACGQVTQDDGRPVISTLGKFEAERVDVLYWYDSYMNGYAPELDVSDPNGGGGILWYRIGDDDAVALDVPLSDDPDDVAPDGTRLAARFARLSNSSHGFWSLQYLIDRNGTQRRIDIEAYSNPTDPPDTTNAGGDDR